MRKVIGLLVFILLVGCNNFDAKTSKHATKKKNSTTTSEISNDNYVNSITKSEFTTFSVDSKDVAIPDLYEFKPLIAVFPNVNKKIKNITIYSLSVGSGLGYLNETAKPFMNATTLSKAKKYATDEIYYKFNRAQQLTELNNGESSYNFRYDKEGHPVSIIVDESGYRGSPEYKLKYTISWKGDKPISLKRDLIEFESDYEEPNEENVPFDLNFTSDPVLSNILEMLSIKTTNVKIIQNACKISGKSPSEEGIYQKGDKAVYWCEIEYFKD